MLKGIGASPGVAMGRALVYKNEQINVHKMEIEDVGEEKIKLQRALKTAKDQITLIKREAIEKLGLEKGRIFDAHLMILEDPELISQVKNRIERDHVNVEWALNEVINTFVALFEGMDNEYMRERATDIKDVGARILKNLMGVEIINLATLEEEIILVAHDLTPSDIAMMDKERVVGFVTDVGGRTSHTAIMAKSLAVPAIVGLKDITQRLKSGDLILFDGEEGIVFINPEDKVVHAYQEKKNQYMDLRNQLKQLREKPTVSKDGRRVRLAANIGTPKDIKGALENGAEGVGLYRTEFLYMNRSMMPTEEEQFEAYKEVLMAMKEKPVIIRTLDIGGDKVLSYLNLPKEINPFLGYRAIRICLDHPDAFKVQLRALLRASVFGNLKIMYPMISSVEEVRAANAVLKEVKDELDAEGIEYSKSIEVGIMIEVPSAVVIGDLLIKEVDFFSIGTNDLIQYTTAVDRTNEKISYLYESFHPGVLRMIKMAIDYAHGEGKWVGMCGEMAGDPRAIPLLFGLGLDEFSMSGISILEARKMVCNLSYEEMQKIAKETLMLSTAEEIKVFLKGAVS